SAPSPALRSAARVPAPPHSRPHLGATRRPDGFRRGGGLRQLGQAEVENLDPAVFRDEKVLGLQIAMRDAFLVCRRKALRDLDAVLNRLPGRKRATLQTLTQRLSLEQLRNQVR